MGRTGPIVLVALALSGGCLPFIAPEEGPSRLRVSLTVRDGEPPQARIQGVLDVSADDLGRVRGLEVDELRVWGLSLDPELRRREHLDRYVYEASWRAAPDDLARREVILEGPQVQGGGPGAELRVPLIWRAGPETVVLPSDGDLRLPLRGVSDSSDFSHVEVRWSLRARGAGAGATRTRFSRESEGLPPDTLRLPPEWMEELKDGPVEIGLTVAMVRVESAPGSGYAAELFLALELAWRAVPGGSAAHGLLLQPSALRGASR